MKQKRAFKVYAHSTSTIFQTHDREQETDIVAWKQLRSGAKHHRSNIAAKQDVRQNDIVFSRQMWTNPVDIKSDKFLNCMLFTHTSCGLDEVERSIKEIECICGRKNDEKDKNIVKIDIDILLYGDKRLHDKDWTRGYVKELMKECPF